MERARRIGQSFEAVIALHPQAAGDVRQLLLSNPTFREVCEDYLLVRQMIADLDAQSSPDIETARKEYLQLAADLALDIERALAVNRKDPAT
jgi:hypothetical protein